MRVNALNGKPYMENATDEKFTIPTRKEHEKFIRKVWMLCIIGAVLVFAITGTTVLVMILMGYDSKTIVNASTTCFQMILLPYGLGYVAPTLATSLLKMALGVEMSRRGLEIGEQTAQSLVDLKNDTKPMIENGGRVMTKLEPMIQKADRMIEQFEKQDFAKLHKVLERFEGEMNGGGKLDRLVTALEKIAKRTDQKADDVLGGLLEEAWGEPKKDPPEGT